MILAHARSTLATPSGPLAGERASTVTLILLEHHGEYEIVAFHNTLVSG